MKNGFYKIGRSILNQVYENTVFNKASLKLHMEDSEEDNFTVVLDSCRKLAVLKPILKPNISVGLFTEVRKHALVALSQCLATCDHTDESVLVPVKLCKQEDTVVVVEEDDEDMPWLNEFACSKDAKPEVEKTVGDDPEAVQVQKPDGKSKIKRRLRRNDSEFDKKTKTRKPRNCSRQEMMDMAKSIFDIAIDSETKGITVSAVITLLLNYELTWERFPKDDDSVRLVPYERIS